MVNLGSYSGRKSLSTVTLLFKLPYYTQWGQSLLISGSEAVLGSWNVKKGLVLSPFHQGNELIWCGKIFVPIAFTCEYSYYLVDDDRNILRWEGGKKRNLILPEGLLEGEVVEIHDLWQNASEALFLRSAFKNVIFGGDKNLEPETSSGALQKNLEWKDSIVVQFVISCPYLEVGSSEMPWRGAGVAIPMFSIRSNDDLGVGEFLDLKLLVDLAVDSGFHLVQLLPVNDTSVHGMWWDSYPYRELVVDLASKSPPNYIVLSDGTFRLKFFPQEMPWRGAGVAIPMFSIRSNDDLGVGEFLDLKLLVDLAVDSGFHLVQLLPVNDTSVHGMWWDSYPYRFSNTKCLFIQNVDYEATMAAKLSIAKKVFNLEKDKILDSSSFKKFFSVNEEWLKPYAAFCFLRDFFETSDHTQWGRFSHFSKEKLEKLVSEDSLHYGVISFHYYVQFHLHLQLSEAAAYARKKKVVLKGDLPIDYFDKNGQNWGFPTYNWEEMSKDNYAWWRARLSQMAKYFTAYRIDHILGFFRIWELPDHAVTGLVGKFRPSIALSQEELEKEGIWDFNRLSCPYIRQGILQDKFGSLWTVIAANFLNEYQKLCYEFKEDCNTEKKIIAKLKSSPGKLLWLDKEDKIRNNLFDLLQIVVKLLETALSGYTLMIALQILLSLQNIVLIRDPEDSRKFYPRFNLEDTSSFKDLDEHSKNVLKRLYYDYYFCRQETLWRQNALKTLPVLLNSSDMLACGEDLGLIPSCVHPVMQELGLISLCIQRMPKIAYFVIQQHCQAPSMWAIFPLQDLLALKEEYTTRPAVEETINDPTNPKHYWRYRVHVTLESLLGDVDLKTTIKDLVRSSGRSFPVTVGSDVQENQNNIAGLVKKQIKNEQEKISMVHLNDHS
ncbi:4-alpha-glucanotransferase DPE2 [Cocos nucifera]|uniref:4-alpha-glucanotransferase n=1 Tax=Cocos nucifera TaxID=13894 RepID=A0A8K0IYS4_COCNU|nr:4-alpha-glucanotransferase DPE2 [Cocos nucifera]